MPLSDRDVRLRPITRHQATDFADAPMIRRFDSDQRGRLLIQVNDDRRQSVHVSTRGPCIQRENENPSSRHSLDDAGDDYCPVTPSSAQVLSGPPANPAFKFSTPLPSDVAAPDTVETRFGTLRFFDGVPDVTSTEKIYDNLDFQRAVQAYLLALPVVNQVANRNAILALGPANTTVPIWETMVDSRTVELTANDNTP